MQLICVGALLTIFSLYIVPKLCRTSKANYLDRCARQIQQWLRACSNHPGHNCTQSGSDILPRRLIFLDTEPNTQRLVQATGSPKYVALSYCWGPNANEHFKTVPSNLHIMEKSIPHQDLPQTLKDVFSLVRKLGYQYLWIDALCIVQDDNGAEWHTEAAKMGDVYANADLVIAAMASSGVNSGLNLASETNFTAEQKSEFHYIMRTCRTMTQQKWYQIRSTYPLLCRGWAFQERLLARRIVHFTIMELIWECTGDRWCECGGDVREKLTGSINNMNSALKQCRLDSSPLRLMKQTLMWRECVKSYSKRDLTVNGDRLYAINGIASYIRGPDSPSYHQLYFHGLWKDSMPWDLLWYCDQTSEFASQKPRGPSYSWCSVDCGIEWMTCKHWEPQQKFSLAISTGTCLEFAQNEQDVQLAKFELLPPQAPQSGSHPAEERVVPLQIDSKMTAVHIRSYSGSEKQALHPDSLGLVEANGSGCTGVLPFYPDTDLKDLESDDSRPYYYIEIMRSLPRNAGLVIRPKTDAQIGEEGGLFERVGLAGDISCEVKIMDSCWSWSADVETCSVLLV